MNIFFFCLFFTRLSIHGEKMKTGPMADGTRDFERCFDAAKWSLTADKRPLVAAKSSLTADKSSLIWSLLKAL